MKVLLLPLLVAAVVAAVALADNPPPQQYRQQPSTYQEPSYGPAQYQFNWAVQDDYSGNDFGHNEERNGDSTSGSYYVQLPDGRRQKVTYTVDGYGGYQAEVTYEGEAQYPPAPAPSAYKPAPPAPYKPAPQPSYPAPAPAPSYNF